MTVPPAVLFGAEHLDQPVLRMVQQKACQVRFMQLNTPNENVLGTPPASGGVTRENWIHSEMPISNSKCKDSLQTVKATPFHSGLEA